MDVFEICAAALGIISVYLLTKQNWLCWPTGIVMVVMYIFIFYGARLYSDMLLQVFFALMQMYGWYAWTNRSQSVNKLQVTFLSNRQRSYWVGVIIFIALLLGYLMKRFTNADLPYLDAATTSISLVAQWWMTRKYIENWLLWIIADVVYVAMYAYKELYATSLLYAVFLVLAILGWYEWKKSYTLRSAISN